MNTAVAREHPANSQPRLWSPPWTFLGIARRAQRPRSVVVFAWAVGVAFTIAAAALCLFGWGWAPALDAAIAKLPDSGQIRRGQLEWREPTPQTLVETRFFSVAIDLANQSRSGQASDIGLKFGGEGIRFYSLLGFFAVPYPTGYVFDFNRPAVQPWWGAWKQTLLVGASLLVGMFFLGVWCAVAVVYAAPVRFVSWIARRELDWRGCWRLALAAQLPGGFLFAVMAGLYAAQQLTFLAFLVAGGLTFGLAWVYLLIAPFRLERKPQSPRGNPFAAPPNPFAQSGERLS